MPVKAVPTTIWEALAHTRQAVADAGISEAALEAEVLLCHVLGVERASLLAWPERSVTGREMAALGQLVARRRAREPLAYVLGQREFYGLSFIVGPAVMVPRPETETLVEEALRWTSQRAPDGEGLIIADIGTGSGCIAVSLAVRLPRVRLIATDTSHEALEAARQNCLRHGVAGRVSLLHGDLLAALPGPVDLIVANLPYVPDEDVARLQPEVSCYEPPLALRGGPDGLALLRRLLAQAPAYLRPGGSVMLEIDPAQRQALEREAQARFPGAAVKVVRDLAAAERVLIVEEGRCPS